MGLELKVKYNFKEGKGLSYYEVRPFGCQPPPPGATRRKKG